jgi:hypothetical protein
MAKKGKTSSTYTDREVLEMFVEADDELLSSTFAEQIKKGVKSSLRTVPEGIETSVEGPEHESTKAFLLTLRLFGQDNDETSLRNMATRVQGLVVSQGSKDRFLKSRENFNTFLDSSPPIQVPDKDADTKRKIFEAFLYGIYAHTAEEHRRTVRRWREQIYYSDLEAQFYVILGNFLAAVTAMANACRDMLKEMPAT